MPLQHTRAILNYAATRRLYVRSRWQFVQTISHFATSARITDRARVMIRVTSYFLVAGSR